MTPRERFDRWFRADERMRREIDEEIDAHLDARTDHLIARGKRPEEARAEAVRRFGDVQSAKKALVAQAAARRRRLELGERLGRLNQDVRFIVRSLWASRSFTAGVIATFALGLGVNAAVFRITDQVLLRPPAGVAAPGEIRRVEAAVTIGSAAPMRATSFSYGDATRIVQSGAFAATSAYAAPRLLKDGEGLDVSVSYVDAAYFTLLGVPFSSGRPFTPDEAAPGSAHGVAIASYAHARRVFGDRPLDDRATIEVGGRSYRLVGVTGRGFSGIEANPIDVWVPLGDAELGRGSVNGVPIMWYQTEMARPLRLIGRLGGDRPEALARDRLDAALAGAGSAADRSAALHPIVPAGDATRAEELTRLLIRLTVAAGAVLLIACANAVNLLLARSIRRAREIGVRVALGASRGRVMRLLVIESLLLAAAGAAAAVLSSQWTAEALRRLVLPDSRWSAASFDARTLVFTFGLALLTGLVAGLVPALQATGGRVAHALKEGRSPGVRGGRTRSALIVAQTSLSLALLIACGLLVSSLLRLHSLDLGFEPSGLVTVARGRAALMPQQVEELGDRLRHVPGVQVVSVASVVPFGATTVVDITVIGAPPSPALERENPMFNAVDHEYFQAMRMRILRGRGLLASDTAGAAPVAVVNATMARRYWGPLDPFDSCILAPPNPCARVVGVVSDIRDAPGADAAPMRYYLSRAQTTARTEALILRVAPERVGGVVAAVRSLVPGDSPPTIDVVKERVAVSLRPWSTATVLFLSLGAVALALASVGIYSVMSYLVSERLYEMGIRLALGATRADITRLVLRRGIRLVLAGTALGLGAALLLGRVIQSLLFQVSTFEPAIYGLAAAAFLALAVGAMLPVARRAALVEPVQTLRAE